MSFRDYYRTGASVGVTARVGDGLSDLGITGAQYASQLVRTDAFISQIDVDIREQSAQQTYIEQWRRFVASWVAFRDLNRVPPLVPLPPPAPSIFVSPSSWQELLNYDRQARAWRRSFESRGGQPTTPEPEPPPTGLELHNPLAPSGDAPMFWVFAGAATMVGIALLMRRSG